MPSNPINDFLASIDLNPVDVATLLAGFKASVPLGMLFRSGELLQGEQEALERKYAGIPRAAPVPREPTVEEQIAEFERQFPNPVMRRVMVEELLKQRQLQPQPKPALGPRRVYPEPVITQEMRPIRRMKGGSVKKTLDEMQAELAKKGVKDAPDLSRRSFFGLPQSQSFPLAKFPAKELEKLKDAPSVEQSMTRITPSADAPKIEQTVKKVAETPVSRRTVLRSATGQVLRGMLPETGVPGVGDIAKSVPSVPDIIKSVVQPAAESAAESAARDSIVRAALTQASMPGVVARGIKQGIEYPDEIVDFVTRELGGKMKNINPENIETAYYSLNNPYGRDASPLLGATTRPSDAWMYFTGLSDAYNRAPLSVLKESMRSVKQTDPDIYETLKNYVRDVSAFSVENALGEGKRIPFNVRSSMGTYKKD